MLDINVSFLSISSKFVQTFVPSVCQQASACLMYAVRYGTTSPETSPHLMTSQWRHRNKTHSWYSVLNSLQNVHFGFFTFGKLIE